MNHCVKLVPELGKNRICYYTHQPVREFSQSVFLWNWIPADVWVKFAWSDVRWRFSALRRKHLNYLCGLSNTTLLPLSALMSLCSLTVPDARNSPQLHFFFSFSIFNNQCDEMWGWKSLECPVVITDGLFGDMLKLLHTVDECVFPHRQTKSSLLT